MKTVQVKSLIFGQGMPKICVPLMGKNMEELLEEAQTISSLPADLVEWRMDACVDATSPKEIVAILHMLRRVVSLPVLCTFRTQKEGGMQALSNEEYMALLQLVISSGCADLVDIELFAGEFVPALLAFAHENGVKVVLSNHDFHQTPSEEELYYRLQLMHNMGADLPKIAVMPQNTEDVLTLLRVTQRASADFGPIITMSMGALGMVSRIAGETFGSCLTFGAAKQASAPGQLEVTTLKKILQVLRLPLEAMA